MATDHTRPDIETEETEEKDAKAAHAADRAPTPEEDQVAPGKEDLDPEAAARYKEAIERGADVKGEGEIS